MEWTSEILFKNLRAACLRQCWHFPFCGTQTTVLQEVKNGTKKSNSASGIFFTILMEIHQGFFSSFLLFVQKRNIEEPVTPQGRAAILEGLFKMNSIQFLGPIVKLMRWYSWFECEEWWQGENYATKFHYVG